MTAERGALSLKSAIATGVPVVGGWVGLDHPGVAKLIAVAGFDWICLDTQHGHFSTSSVRACMDAITPTNTPVLIRVVDASAAAIGSALDLGADGVIVPSVGDAQYAQRAVNAAFYPPIGARSHGALRATDYGTARDNYTPTAESTIVLAQIESRAGLQNVDEIAAVDHIDALFVGPYDLAADLGHSGDLNHPTVLAAYESIARAAALAGKALGTWCRDAVHAAELTRHGVTILSWTTDFLMLGTAARGERVAFDRAIASMTATTEA